jgi:hypothetical protein
LHSDLAKVGSKGEPMKRKFKIVTRWEPEQRFTLPLHYHAPIARRMPDFPLENLLNPLEDIWQSWTPLR